MLQITLNYDKTLLRQAVKHFWWRAIGPYRLAGLCLGQLILAALIFSGDRSWYVGMLGTLDMLATVLLPTIYWVHYRNVMQKLADMGTPRALATLDSEQFSVKTDNASASLAWSRITEVWRFDTVWLLLFSRSQFMTLPLADLSPEAQAIVLERVRAAGGQLR